MTAIRCLWVLAGLAVSCAVWGATLTVDDDGPADFSSIQAAIDAAAAGDVVSVAAGTYFENIELKSGVRVIGAGADQSTVDGSGLGSVAVLQDCDATTSLEGFTITNGQAVRGGGVLVERGAPVITLNVITENSVVRERGMGAVGGGLALLSTAARVVENRIEANLAAPKPDYGSGGGLFIQRGGPLVRRNVIANNSVSIWGGGVFSYESEARIDANTISGNSAGRWGGGIEVIGRPAAIISNNLIVGNTASWGSGGVDMYPTNSVLINNTIADNQSYEGTGAFIVAADSTSPRLINNVFFRNIAVTGGGGLELLVSRSSSVALLNNHFFMNLPTFCAGFWICDDACTASPDDTLCEDETTLHSDPLLVDPDASNFWLRAGSPAIDSARSEDAPMHDFRGQRRRLDGNGDGVADVDRGAFEYDRNDVPGLRFAAPDTLTWDAAIGASSYHMYSGAVSSLSGSGVDTCRDAEDGDLSDLTFTVIGSPGDGDGFAYLVTAVIDGSEQSTGFDSRGLERSNPSPCP